jgi:hypothetical protein
MLSCNYHEVRVTCGILEMHLNEIGIRDESVVKLVDAPESHKRFHGEKREYFRH